MFGTEPSIPGPTGAVQGSLHIIQLLASCFMRLLAVRPSGVVTLVPVLGTLSFLLGCHVQFCYDSVCFVLLYFILSCLVVTS